MRNGLLIGLGTGRCGTTSLAHLLNSAEDCSVTHESGVIRLGLSWNFSEKGIKKALDIMGGVRDKKVGDIAFYYLPYVEWIASQRPEATFVCMRRDREETIESYMKKSGTRDHWSSMRNDLDPWDRMYPRFKTDDKRAAIGMYWDMYYEETDRLERSGIRIKTFDMHMLNEDSGVERILDFCGLRCLFNPVGIKKNSL